MAAEKKMAPEQKDAGTTSPGRSLRDEAEERLARSRKISPTLKGQTPDELIHELQVHQIELEMQAEELQRAHLALEESRDKYLDLYEFAPLGYLMLNDEAIIADVNLAGATLLGLPRSRLERARFRKFVAPQDSEAWDRYFMRCCSTKRNSPPPLCSRGRTALVSPPGWKASDSPVKTRERQQSGWQSAILLISGRLRMRWRRPMNT
ncbi:MAG: PAS domain-containing protein [Methanoregula sp.]